MIKVNVMRSFLNRQRDRGWKNINVRGNTSQDTQVLRRVDQSIVVVENINLDASGGLEPQVEEFFASLVRTIAHSEAKDVFLSGGGEIKLPQDFEAYCRQNGIRIHIVTLENFRVFLDKEI
jgi:hypothetical protein